MGDSNVLRPASSSKLEKKSHYKLKNSISKKRNPLTQQYVASYLSEEKRGKIKHPHPASEHFPNALYISINKMVTMICNKYAISSKVDVNDLIQDCFLRICRTIDSFDSSKSQFTTWCWWICSNLLKTRYNTNIRHCSRFTGDEDIERFGETRDEMLAEDITGVIRYIAEKYPTKKKILFSMFGDPDNESFCLPSNFKLSQVSRDTGIKYCEVYTFFNKAIKPIFQEFFLQKG